MDLIRPHAAHLECLIGEPVDSYGFGTGESVLPDAVVSSTMASLFFSFLSLHSVVSRSIMRLDFISDVLREPVH
jgi:hypothetical protein